MKEDEYSQIQAIRHLLRREDKRDVKWGRGGGGKAKIEVYSNQQCN